MLVYIDVSMKKKTNDEMQAFFLFTVLPRFPSSYSRPFTPPIKADDEKEA